ncbi:hypothetical protein BC830DRAFT_1245534, partial [Chytriomyces sp. MP71]
MSERSGHPREGSVLCVSAGPTDGRFGGAMLGDDGVLRLVADVFVGDGDALATVVALASPRSLLLSSKCPESILKLAASVSAELILVPSSHFVYKTARNRLLSLHALRLSCSGTSVSFDGVASNDRLLASLHLESIASLANIHMVGCAGALLAHVSNSVNTRETDNGGESGTDGSIVSVEALYLDTFMNLNQDCFHSLNIFCN